MLQFDPPPPYDVPPPPPSRPRTLLRIGRRAIAAAAAALFALGTAAAVTGMLYDGPHSAGHSTAMLYDVHAKMLYD